MAKKKNAKKTEQKSFLGSLERLGGKKLMQQGAEESSRGRQSRKHRVGGGGRKSGRSRTSTSRQFSPGEDSFPSARLSIGITRLFPILYCRSEFVST
jgi:hypothetical protein